MKIDVGHVAGFGFVHSLLTRLDISGKIQLLNRPVRSQDVCRAFLWTRI